MRCVALFDPAQPDSVIADYISKELNVEKVP